MTERKCEIIYTAIPNPSPYGFASVTALCLTHNYPCGTTVAGENVLCPIGRIEEATEEAIEKIAKSVPRKI